MNKCKCDCNNERFICPSVYTCFGPTGPTGPTGPATITVGTTVTGSPGTNASVTNQGTNKNAVLNFTIPQGLTGATGPTGPTGATPTISLDSILVSNDGLQTVTTNSALNLGTVINTTGTNITFTAPNTVNITTPGTYYVLFEVLAANTSTSGDVGASMEINGTIVPTASEYVSSTTTQTQFVLQHNITITSNSTITINNNSTVSNNYHDSSISVIKIA